MRLDEWQKFIETQFLEDTPEKPKDSASVKPEDSALVKPEDSASVKPVVSAPEKPMMDFPQSLPEKHKEAARAHASILLPEELAALTAPLLSASETPTAASTPMSASPVLESPPPTDTTARDSGAGLSPTPSTPQPPLTHPTRRERTAAALPSTTQKTPLSFRSTVNPPASTGTATPQESHKAPPPHIQEEKTYPQSHLFSSLTQDDVEIPAFEHYLPSSRAHRLERKQDIAPVSSPETPVTPLERIVPSGLPPDLVSAVESLALESTESLPRRIPKTRARHARNVRPENVPSGLSAAELWSSVPRHVQTLLALERLEEEEETAQHSYKRPFQEKRHELIERLLDPILSLEDTARLLNVCPTTVRRYTNKGILTHYRKEPERAPGEVAPATDKETRQRRFRLSDILAFLEAQQVAIEADRRKDARALRRQEEVQCAHEEAMRIARSEAQVPSETGMLQAACFNSMNEG